MKRKSALTLDQLFRRGKTLTKSPAERDDDRIAIHRVMSGTGKVYYGNAHRVTIEPGLKLAEVEPSTPASAGNTQRRVTS